MLSLLDMVSSIVTLFSLQVLHSAVLHILKILSLSHIV